MTFFWSSQVGVGTGLQTGLPKIGDSYTGSTKQYSFSTHRPELNGGQPNLLVSDTGTSFPGVKAVEVSSWPLTSV